jgi:hypothetical protein
MCKENQATQARLLRAGFIFLGWTKQMKKKRSFVVINYTKKAEIEVTFVSRSFMSCRSSKFLNQLQATLSKCPGFVLNVRCCFFVSLVIVSHSVLFIFIVISWGIEPGHGRAACICSKFARTRSRRGSRGRDGRLRHSCSTFDPGCSRLEVVREIQAGEELRCTRHVSVATARVAGLSSSATSTAEAATTVSTLLLSTESSTVSASLWAVAGDVTDL